MNSPIRSSVETDKIDAAMAAAQVDLENPIKGKTANLEGTSKTSGKDYQIGYAYADIADILSDCRPILAGHGIAIYQIPVINDGRALMIVTRLSCSGQWIEGDYPVCMIGGNHQEMGKAMTYARRYALGAMIGIAPEKDTDGIGAAAPGSANAQDQARQRNPEKLRRSTIVVAAESAIIMCEDRAALDAWKVSNKPMLDGIDNDDDYNAIIRCWKSRWAALAPPKAAEGQERAVRGEEVFA